MAGEVTKTELGSVLKWAMLAQKNIGLQFDCLLQLRRRLQQQLKPSEVSLAAGLRELALDLEHINPAFAAGLNELAAMRMDLAVVLKHVELYPEIFKVYHVGVQAGVRSICTCLRLAAKNGARVDLDPAFPSMPDEQLYDALVAPRLPARPATQTEAFSRLEAALYAIQLSREHHLPRCIELLTGISPTSVTGKPSDDSSEDDPVAAATEHLAKTDISDPAPAAATGEPPQAPGKRSVDVDKARDYLDRACTLWNLAVNHIDLAVAFISSFLDPKEVASLSDYTDRVAHATTLRTDRITDVLRLIEDAK
ncbi:hypothetical protein ACQ4PT_063046 [Festuca glaucescens]